MVASRCLTEPSAPPQTLAGVAEVIAVLKRCHPAVHPALCSLAGRSSEALEGHEGGSFEAVLAKIVLYHKLLLCKSGVYNKVGRTALRGPKTNPSSWHSCWPLTRACLHIAAACSQVCNSHCHKPSKSTQYAILIWRQAASLAAFKACLPDLHRYRALKGFICGEAL